MKALRLSNRQAGGPHILRNYSHRPPAEFSRSGMALRLHMLRLLGPLSLDQVIYLTERAQLREYRAGEKILDGAAASRYHLLVLQGDVEVQRKLADNHDTCSHYCTLRPLDVTGGFAFLGAVSPVLRATAVTGARCLLIDADLADELLGWCAHFAPLRNTDPKLWHRINRMHSVGVFSRIPPYRLEAVIRGMAVRKVRAGETVIAEGETGDGYYTIEEGEAGVWRTGPVSGEQERVARLGPGDAFGEEALSGDGCRDASVSMLRRGRLRVLSRADFMAQAGDGWQEEFTAAEVQTMVQDGKVRVLDCRCGLELQEPRIPGSVNMPLDRLRWDLHELDPAIQYAVCCRSGRLARVAAYMLRQMHIRATSLEGGINAWPYALEWGEAA